MKQDCQRGTDRGDVKLIQIAQTVSMKGFHHNGDERELCGITAYFPMMTVNCLVGELLES
jgi:hypothetical protein